MLDPEKFIVKTSMGPRYVVGVSSKLNKASLEPGTRVTLDPHTLTIMRILPREVNPIVHNMIVEGREEIPFSEIGGLATLIRDLRETIKLSFL
jgi:26S proteasome regulatory subunit T4